jgi:flagellar export protein FliJ
VKALETLIRLRRDALDRRRQVLASLEQRRADVTARRSDLERRITEEQSVASANENLMFSYNGFARKSIQDRAELEGVARELDSEIEAASEDLQRAFTELKKFEIARDQRDQREKIELDRQERRTGDELALSRFRHKRLRLD